jgi:Reverse transcriptase (RNA-dependent DNA polymerase)
MDKQIDALTSNET